MKKIVFLILTLLLFTVGNVFSVFAASAPSTHSNSSNALVVAPAKTQASKMQVFTKIASIKQSIKQGIKQIFTHKSTATKRTFSILSLICSIATIFYTSFTNPIVWAIPIAGISLALLFIIISIASKKDATTN